MLGMTKVVAWNEGDALRRGYVRHVWVAR
jgi:hypothetical protein